MSHLCDTLLWKDDGGRLLPWLAERLQGAQGWADREFDRLAERQLVTADTQARRRVLARMQTIIARDLPALALYYPTVSHVFRRRAFEHWYVTPGGFAGGLPRGRQQARARHGQADGTAYPATASVPTAAGGRGRTRAQPR